MAVYTQVSSELLGQLLQAFDVGALQSAKGIAEGVENSNYLVDTERARFILTLYEKRVQRADLPFFLNLMTHLAMQGLPVPLPVANREGAIIHELAGRAACLIEFLPGVSVDEPRIQHCHALGETLGRMHKAAADFAMARPNDFSVSGWRKLAKACGSDVDRIETGLGAELAIALDYVAERWPTGLVTTVIHADLFPNNVLFQGEKVSGLIDFYFAATDVRAYDVAVCLNSWCFSADGRVYHQEKAAALLDGYSNAHGLSMEEKRALPILCQGAALRFLLTRAYDWLNTPLDAMVTRLDPLAYARRLRFYAQASPEQIAPLK